MNKLLPILLILFSTNVISDNKTIDSMEGVNLFCNEYKSKISYAWFPVRKSGGETIESSLGIVFGKEPEIEIIKAATKEKTLKFSKKYFYFAYPSYVSIHNEKEYSMFEKWKVDIGFMDKCAKGCEYYFIDRMSGKVYEHPLRFKAEGRIGKYFKTLQELIEEYEGGEKADTWNCEKIETRAKLITQLQNHHLVLNQDYMKRQELKKKHREMERIERDKRSEDKLNNTRDNRKF